MEKSDMSNVLMQCVNNSDNRLS